MSLRHRLVPLLILALTVGTFVAFAGSSSAAATITVNTSDDELNIDGDCSLREAVEAANTNAPVDGCTAGDPGTDTVVFAPSTDGNPINLASPIVITEALTIDGNGPSATIVQGDEFDVVPGITATFRDMTLELVDNEGGTVSITNVTATDEMNNNATGADVATMTISNSTVADLNNNSGFGTAETNLTINRSTGGFITNNSGSGTSTHLTVSGSTFDGIENTSGGAPPSTTTASISSSTINGAGGVVSSAGPGSSTTVTITITSTTVTGATGSGIVNNSAGASTSVSRSTVFGNGENGILVNDGEMTVSNSTISGNSGHGIVGATNVNRTVVLENGGNGIVGAGTVTNSTISRNAGEGITRTSTVRGSTVNGNRGNGIQIGFEMTVTNSTITGNRFVGIGNPDGAETATITSSTITNNGLGIDSAEDGQISAKNSIVFGNRGGDCGGAAVNSFGGNIDGDGTCQWGAPGDQPETDPMLGPLAQNGGPTRTQMPLAGSPAIDRAVDCPPPSGDQRGISRPRDGDGNGLARCDVGSVEVTQAVIPSGGVDTGLGGTASRRWPVVPVIVLGLVLLVVLSIRLLPRRS